MKFNLFYVRQTKSCMLVQGSSRSGTPICKLFVALHSPPSGSSGGASPALTVSLLDLPSKACLKTIS